MRFSRRNNSSKKSEMLRFSNGKLELLTWFHGELMATTVAHPSYIAVKMNGQHVGTAWGEFWVTIGVEGVNVSLIGDGAEVDVRKEVW